MSDHDHITARRLAVGRSGRTEMHVVAAGEESCGMGHGDFCRHMASSTIFQSPRCELFKCALEISGEVDDRRVNAAARNGLALAITDAHRRHVGAILDLGPVVDRCPECRRADVGPASVDELPDN